MALRAIVSDLHGNLEATKAVIEDGRRAGAESIVCLGDVINYGPDPVECMRLAETFTLTLRGNNEQALIHGAERFRPAARRALAWTRRRLVEAFGEANLRARIERMPLSMRDGPCLFVHGSPRDPLDEYLSYRDVFEEEGRARLETIFREYLGTVRACYCGHTHAPGLIIQGTGTLMGLGGTDLPETYTLGRDRVIAVVGSVGQPRDHRRAASYVLEDSDTGVIHFRRVPYPVERTAAKALRELFLWEYACRLLNRPVTVEAARKLAEELQGQGLLTADEAAEVRYFLRLAEPDEEAPP